MNWRIALAAVAGLAIVGQPAVAARVRAEATGANGVHGGSVIPALAIIIIPNRKKTPEAAPTKPAAPAPTTPRTPRPGITAAEREANREVQTALNYFDFPVGTPDGALGPKSRSAISEYQTLLGYEATGRLTGSERELLVGSYKRAVADEAATAALAEAHALGKRGLLLDWRDAGKEAPVIALGETPEGLPTFGNSDGRTETLVTLCDDVAQLTAANGGLATAETMADPIQALGEQFCLVREQVMVEGEDLAKGFAGATEEQIASQCSGFARTMTPSIVEMSSRPAQTVLIGARQKAMESSQSVAELVVTFKVCLGTSYRAGNVDAAIGAALALAALGEVAVGEMIGHHLALGLGAPQRPDLAVGWYELSATGVRPYVTEQPERNDLILMAAFQVLGQTSSPEADAPDFTIEAAPDEGEIVVGTEP